MNKFRMKLVGLIGFGVICGLTSASAQSSNPFVPDFAWCATQGSVAVRNATSWGCLTPGLNGQVLISQGPGQNAAWSSAVGTGSVTSVALSLPPIFSVSGSPVTTSGTLTATLANQSPNLIWSGPASGGAAAPTFRALVGADLPNPSASTLGGVQSRTVVANNFMTGISTSGVPTLAQVSAAGLTGSLPIAQIDSIGAGTVLSNVTGGSAAPSANAPSAVLDVIGSTRGSLLYRGASGWSTLPPGTASYVLTSNGTGADPTWQTVSATPASTTYSVVGALSGTGTSTRTQTSIDKEDLLIVFDNVQITATASVNISFSIDNGSTWLSGQPNIDMSLGSNPGYTTLYCTGLKAGYVQCTYSARTTTGNGSGESAVFGFYPGAQINAVRFVTSSGNWLGGTTRIFGR